MPRQHIDPEEKRRRRLIWEAEYRKKNRKRIAANQKRHNATEKGKARYVRYENTEKAKARAARYNSTPKSKQRYKRYRKNHPDRVKSAKLKWKSNNPDKVRKHDSDKRARIKANPARLHAKRASLNRWFNAKWKSDPIFRLKYTLRLRLRQALKHGKHPGQRALELLGCTLIQFKAHIESQFAPGMTWQNHGMGDKCWHIDHMHPVSRFDLTDPEQVKKCFHFSNLAPLWAPDNVKKSNKIL